MLSLVSGPTTPPLESWTLGRLIAKQAKDHSSHTSAVFPWQANHRLTYQQLSERSATVAKSLLALGVRHGDRVGILAGNRYEFLETFYGSARIGCPFVVLNNTYTPRELLAALKTSGCTVLIIAAQIGLKDLTPHLSAVHAGVDSLSLLKHVILLSDSSKTLPSRLQSHYYDAFVSQQGSSFSDQELARREDGIRPEDILNLQFTSGNYLLCPDYWIPQGRNAFSLILSQIITNARYIGLAMRLSSKDIVCCPPPLFHAFGLVMGLLATFVTSGTIVFPSDQFDPYPVLDALRDEKCTVLHGVPTMFAAAVEANLQRKYNIRTVRTGLVGGANVPVTLMKRIHEEFGADGLLIAYGMTETSPVTFLTALDDPDERKAKTVGRVLPHIKAKVIDGTGKIVPRGVRGELCISGYCLQAGYWENKAKTDEVMIKDEKGVMWLHTGDECIIDEEDYCSVTGRTKDIIIRGGENIYPGEIAERLLEHSSITETAVVGIVDEKYGEVVGTFCRQAQKSRRPDLSELNGWVREVMGGHKAPRYLFWIGDPGVGEDFPKTGSGKIQMHNLRAIAQKLLEESGRKKKAKL